MNLLIVTPKVDKNDENVGAFYYWFEELAHNFDTVTIIASGVGEHAPPDHVSVRSLGKISGETGLARFFGKAWRMIRFYAIFPFAYAKSDAALFHMMPEFVLAASPFLMFGRKVRALWYAHGSVGRRLWLAEKLVDYVFTSSPEGFRLPSKKVHHLGQAIDAERFKPPARPMGGKKELRFISVGRIAPVKDYETIIRACALLKESGMAEWTFSIVGGPLLARDHAYRAMLDDLVRESGLARHVQFLGPRHYSEIPALLGEHDVFLNVSQTGSLDKAVLEAMASGLSVLTANEAYKSIVPQEYFLEHVKPQILAERIKRIAAEPRPNKALREIVVAHHSLSKTMEKMAAILRGEKNGRVLGAARTSGLPEL